MGKLIIFITWDVTIFLILVISTNYFHPPYLDYNYVIKIPRAFYSIPSFLHASRRFPWWLIWASFSDQIELKTLPWAQKSKSGKKKKKNKLMGTIQWYQSDKTLSRQVWLFKCSKTIRKIIIFLSKKYVWFSGKKIFFSVKIFFFFKFVSPFKKSNFVKKISLCEKKSFCLNKLIQ